MSVQSRDIRSSYRRMTWRRAGNLFIALVAWLLGLSFTRQILPFTDIRPWVPWVAALIVQVALTIGQTNLRDYGVSGSRWPYVVLLLIDIGLNTLGLLIASGLADSAMSAILYSVRAVTTGIGLWQTIGLLLVGALVAALPEQLIRDA